MKQALTKFIIISVAVLVFAGASSYFSNNANADVLHVQISVNDQDPWGQTFTWQNFLPGETKEITLAIENVGSDPIKIWQITKNLTNEENGVVEPEGEWYDSNGVDRAVGKNDIDSAITYEMYIGGQVAVEKEAGITLDKIKNYYVGLAKLDPGASPAYNGILNPGSSITVVQKYHFNGDAGNWAQSDKMTFDIQILAQEVSAPEPIKQLSFMNNKNISSGWSAIADNKIGILKYDSTAPTFNYNFTAVGLNPSTNYCLIYYADDYPGNHPGAFFASGNPNAQGELILSGSKDLGFNLPNPSDTNSPLGAKIWLLPCNNYNQITHVVSWSPDNYNWLFDNWPGFINYTKGEAVSEGRTITFADLHADPQYGYTHNYSGADVTFTYNTPATSRLSGMINATGLKPYATYQIKFEGKPTCEYGASGNDSANEYIGYKGRWTVTNTACSGDSCNRTDSQYEASKTNPECVAGYLVWDFFTADSSGNATKAVETANSYHVLWSGGGVCDTNVNTYLAYLDSIHPTVKFSPADKVDGQIERDVCGGLTLDAGTYDLNTTLTEESFHQSPGTWTTVMDSDINFVIN